MFLREKKVRHIRVKFAGFVYKAANKVLYFCIHQLAIKKY